MYSLLAVLAAVAVLCATVLIRAFMFKPKSQAISTADDVYVNVTKAISDLSEMVKCRTVSNINRENEDEAEFCKFKALLKEIFPNIYNSCTYEEVGDRALLNRYRGRSDASPTVLMAHFDVVCAEERQWEKPPFSGIFENGVLWGRGTLDTKVTLNGAMQALEALISEGFVPQNDIYLAFSGNEEISGTGADMIVDLFVERNITPAAVIDEGGAVVSNVFPGVKAPCAVVGIAEKGMLNAEFSYSGDGGHASTPARHTPVGILSAACVKIENHPFKYRISKPTALMFDTLARHSTFVYRMIFANLWLFAPLIDLIGKKTGGELNALLRTTCAFTQMEGSRGMNVIPPNAKMVANLRILPGETTDTALRYLEKTINDPEITVKMISGMNPSVVSDIETDGWNNLTEAIKCTWPEAIVSPYLMVACSDSRHWGRISNRVYRFSAMALTAEDRASIHGNNERVSADTVKKTVEFYIRLIKKL